MAFAVATEPCGPTDMNRSTLSAVLAAYALLALGAGSVEAATVGYAYDALDRLTQLPGWGRRGLRLRPGRGREYHSRGIRRRHRSERPARSHPAGDASQSRWLAGEPARGALERAGRRRSVLIGARHSGRRGRWVLHFADEGCRYRIGPCLEAAGGTPYTARPIARAERLPTGSNGIRDELPPLHAPGPHPDGPRPG